MLFMKRLIAILSGLTLLLALPGCGGQADSSASESETPIVSEESTPAAESEATEETASTEETPEEPDTQEEGVDINVAVLAGPTGIGAVGLMESADNGETVNNYTFTVAAANDDVVAGLTSGEFDIAAVATNVAANLYNKTSGSVEICALNTYGVLYILENGEEVQSISDLAGRTIYATGQGANPEYVLEYLLTENGLSYSLDGSDADVAIEFMASDALVAGMASGEYDLCMLPVPAVTSVELQNTDVRTALDLTAEWEASGAEGVLTMGCMVVRTEFAQEHPEAVASFLEEYAASISAVQADPAHAGELCETYGIVAKAAVATKAIPDCNLCCIMGADIQPAIQPYYQVLFDANPDAIGGALPDEAFYFVP
jgi:NitT/TauT family transport system substrate-binding protein